MNNLISTTECKCIKCVKSSASAITAINCAINNFIILMIWNSKSFFPLWVPLVSYSALGLVPDCMLASGFLSYQFARATFSWFITETKLASKPWIHISLSAHLPLVKPSHTWRGINSTKRKDSVLSPCGKVRSEFKLRLRLSYCTADCPFEVLEDVTRFLEQKKKRTSMTKNSLGRVFK